MLWDFHVAMVMEGRNNKINMDVHDMPCVTDKKHTLFIYNSIFKYKHWTFECEESQKSLYMLKEKKSHYVLNSSTLNLHNGIWCTLKWHKHKSEREHWEKGKAYSNICIGLSI